MRHMALEEDDRQNETFIIQLVHGLIRYLSALHEVSQVRRDNKSKRKIY